MPDPNRLTAAQVMLIEEFVKDLAATGNPIAQALAQSLARHRGAGEKRKVLVGAYANAFALLTVFQMVLDSPQPPEQVRRAWRERRGK